MRRPRRIHARRQFIEPNFFAVAEIDSAKVDSLVGFLKSGKRLPPVVVAMYDDKAMPLDGHHRLSAHRILKRNVDAWVVDGKAFDRLSMYDKNAESLVMCGGIPALKVAAMWFEQLELVLLQPSPQPCQ